MSEEIRSVQKFVIFVGGLNFQTDEISLKQFFSSSPHINGIENVRICRRIEGTSKGFGYVTFNDELSYKQSLALNGSILDGKHIRIEADHSKKFIILNKEEDDKSNISYISSNSSSPIKRKKSKSHLASSDYSDSSYSSYSYSYSSNSSPTSYSSYSSDNEKKKRKHRKNRHKNKKRKHQTYSDYSYSS